MIFPFTTPEELFDISVSDLNQWPGHISREKKAAPIFDLSIRSVGEPLPEKIKTVGFKQCVTRIFSFHFILGPPLHLF